MCLILFAACAHSGYRLIVAANRDEAYERPSAPLAFWHDHPQVCAGRDLEHGGTWLGLSRQGRFAAITNYRQGMPRAAAQRSRGELTRDFLVGVQPPQQYVQQVSARAGAYNGFSLIVGEPDELWFYSNRGGSAQRITPGVHGLSNHLLDEPWPKVTRGIAELKALLGATESELVHELFGVLADSAAAPEHLLPSTGIDARRERALSASFIAGETYGTRASSIVLVGNDAKVLVREKRFGPRGAELGESELRFDLTASPAARAKA
jgi:uncharacterized protein with NRDE domain